MADNDQTDEDFEWQVRKTAYALWEQAGRPIGHDKEHWYAALEQQLERQDTAIAAEPGPDLSGIQADDNIDEFGRPLNNPGSAPLEQPVKGNGKNAAD